MSTKEKIKSIKPMTLYIVLSIVGMAAVAAFLWYSHGDLTNFYFYQDRKDTGMDFLHSIEYTSDRMPYTEFGVQYPPLANLLFYCLFLLVPTEISNNWPRDFIDSVNMRRTKWDLRTWQPTMLLFLLFVILSLLFLYMLAEIMLQEHRHSCLAALCAVLSYGVLYAVERGNILLIALVLTLIFVNYHNAQKAWVREAAILCLALAAGLKLYPAVFGVLLLRDKNIGGAIRAGIYFVASIILPSFVFHEGLYGVPIWLNILMRNTAKVSEEPWIGLSMSSTLSHVAKLIDDIVGTQYAAASYRTAAMVILVVLLAAACVLPKTWQSILALTLVMILYQSQPQYILSFGLVPLLAFMKEEQRFSRDNLLPFLAMAYMVVPLPLFNSTARNLGIHIIFVLVILWCVAYSVHVVRVHNRCSYKGLFANISRQIKMTLASTCLLGLLGVVGYSAWNATKEWQVRLDCDGMDADEGETFYRCDNESGFLIRNTSPWQVRATISFDVANVADQDEEYPLYVTAEDEESISYSLDGEEQHISYDITVPAGAYTIDLWYEGVKNEALSEGHKDCYYTISNLTLKIRN